MEYGSGEIARLANISLRQAQWWDERDVVSPRQVGHRRMYEDEEALTVMVVAELRRKGLSLQRLRAALRNVRWDRLYASPSRVYLLTDGGMFTFVESDHQKIISLFERTERRFYLVCVSDLIAKLIDRKAA